jgi:hypothetical protein
MMAILVAVSIFPPSLGTVFEVLTRVVLADVVVGTGLGVEILITLETRVRKILLVLSKGDSSELQDVEQGGDVGTNLVEVVLVHTEVVTTVDRSVLGLRRMSGTEVVHGDDSKLTESSHVG